MSYPQHPPVQGGGQPPMGWGPRPQPWEAPGQRPPQPLPPQPLPPQPLPLPGYPAQPPRIPAWTWVAIGVLTALAAGLFVWAIDLRSDRDRLRRQLGAAGDLRATATTRPAPGSLPSTTAPATTPTTTPVPPRTTTPPASTVAPAELLAEIENLKRVTERIRGLQFKAPVEVKVLTPEQLAARVREINTQELDPVRLNAEGKRLALMGVVPPAVGARFADYIQDLLAEQVAGFYDPKTKELVVVGSGEIDFFTRITIIHELTHALTDQHFDFGPQLDRLYREQRDDENLAFLGLIEGDATLAMYEAAAIVSDPSDFGAVPDLPPTPLFDSAPQFVKDAFLFPYTEGLTFTQELFEVGGWRAIDTAYGAAPTTTEQILHPEKFTAKEPARAVELADLALGEGWTKTSTSNYGEYGLRLILREGGLPAEEAEAGAAGWGGDRFAQYENGDKLLVVLRIVADSPETTSSAQAAWTNWIGRWNQSGRGASHFATRGDTLTVILSTDDAAATKAAQDLGIG